MSNFTRGDIYYVDAYPVVGHEQQPGRPAVIVSNDKNNEHSSVLEMVCYHPQRPEGVHGSLRAST